MMEANLTIFEMLFGAPKRRRRRSVSLVNNKNTPVTSFLMQNPPPTRSSLHANYKSDGNSPDRGAAPLSLTFNTTLDHLLPERESHSDSEKGIIRNSRPRSKYTSTSSGSEDEWERKRLQYEKRFKIPRCLHCTGYQLPHETPALNSINEMCRRLCTEDCRKGLSLEGYRVEPKSAQQSIAAAREVFVNTRSSEDEVLSSDSVISMISARVPTLSEYATPENVPAILADAQANDMEEMSTEAPASSPPTDTEENIDANISSESEEVASAVATNQGAEFSVLLVRESIARIRIKDRHKIGENSDTDSNFADDECDNSEMYDTELTGVPPVLQPVPKSKFGAVLHKIDIEDFTAKEKEIAEALAKASAMTSTARVKQRLAARKLEIELENIAAHVLPGISFGVDADAVANADADADANATANANANASTSVSHTNANANANANNNCNGSKPIATDVRSELGVTDGNGFVANADVQAILGDRTIASAATAAADASQRGSDYPDIMATLQQNGSNLSPQRELLLYLVRMGSFNSAPKINNIDSQDDGLHIPGGLSTGELLQHIKHLRGEQQPPLISRYFLKPSLGAQMVNSDITDGLRCLKLNSVSRVCSAPISSPNQVRLLQWNILSQTLGQNNDGFVRCPDEALTWDNRKFLIVQEILQHNPDIICLQEVDHFKFLQNILGTQNYEGIFFPKPDSPCLYVEENNGPDGCAIFFKRDKYELKQFDTRILEVWRVQSNQVAIAANLQVKATGKEICVCTTHLKARHGALLSKLRNEQGRDLLKFLKQWAGNRAIILCGDFNAEPTEPVYSTILNYDDLNLSSAYADIKGESDRSDGNDEIDGIDENDGSDACPNGGSIEAEDPNSDRIQRSVNNEPAYTTWKIREEGEVCHTIDYVFYTKDHLKVKDCLEFPQGDEIGMDRTPSLQYPSDHFSLLCDFEIIDKPEQN